MEALTGKRIRPLTVLSQDWQRIEPDQARTAPPDDAIQAFKTALDSIGRYRSFIVKMVVAGALLSGIAGLLLSPSYMATAQLAVNARSAGAADTNGGAAQASAGAEDTTIDTHVTVLLSDAYLRRLLPSLRALDRTEQDKRIPSALWTTHAWTLFRDTWSKIQNSLFVSPREPSNDASIAALKNSLRVSQERRSRIISVAFTDANPQRAADVPNLVARSYANELTRQRQAADAEALDAIALQSAAVQRDLSKTRAELEANKLGHASSSGSAALEWQMTTLAQQYEILLRRRQELATKSAATESEVILIADATPPDRPNSLNPLLLIPPVTIVFAFLACMLAVAFDRMDRTLHTDAEAEAALRIPCAGVLPSISPKLSRRPQHMLERPASAYTRAIRSIVSSLLVSDPVASRSQRVILVTSSLRDEGKTGISWSIAFHAGRLGRRVLLLDLNQSSGPAIDDGADILRTSAQLHQFANEIQHVRDLGIDCLSPEIFDGDRLRMVESPEVSLLLDKLRESYDLVVIDAPSLQVTPEVRFLTRRADHILLVLRAGTTKRETAQKALQHLARTENLNVDAQFWSVLTGARPADCDPPGPERSPAHAFLLPYRRLKAALARSMRTKPEDAPHSAEQLASERPQLHVRHARSERGRTTSLRGDS